MQLQQNQPASDRAVTPREVAAFIAAMSVEMAAMARDAGLPTLERTLHHAHDIARTAGEALDGAS